MLHDLVSMAICLGGLVLVIFTGTSSITNDTDYNLQYNLDYSPYGKRYSLRSMMATAQWFLIAVVLSRLGFGVWGCFDCMTRNMSIEQRRRHRQQMEEAQAFDA
ncbi:hypothetical protein NQ176_g5950 [Zarea fungicola]|uniref:Uncharacterized protein n=1 Tax=Zarea fungicola TaxID=93591 RepID=A0ACC1N6E1_9HYPO|nr:hypothetical protein NQ176_g5950 [Lecanicillium fungicola]